MPNTNSVGFVLASTQYAYVADNADVSPAGDYSIEAWIKLTQLPSTAGSAFVIAAKDTASHPNREFVFYIESNDLLSTYYWDAANAASGSDTDAAIVTGGDVGVWVHLALTVDVSAASFIFYKNGSPAADTNIGSDAATMRDGGAAFTIGARATPALYIDALMDEVRLWKDIRSEAEILANMETQTPAGDNLAGHWHLDGDYTDSENSSDLTGVNTPVFSSDVPFAEAVAGGGAPLIFSGGVVVA